MPFINSKTLAFSLALCVSPAWSAQVCNKNIPETTPSSDFTAHGDGTVTHHKTGLMWKVCSEGQTFKINNGAPTCTGIPSTYHWKGALTQAEGAHFAGKKDWRLPDIQELNSIVEKTCESPAINERVFPSTLPSAYWSSFSNHNIYAWGVHFNYGYDYYNKKSDTRYARLVRTP